MVETVLIFVITMAIAEIVVEGMLKPRTRLRVFGSKNKGEIHLLLVGLNLWIHWGTVAGRVSSTVALITSITAI